MKERLQNIWQTVKEKVTALSSKTKKLIIGAVILCIAVSVGLAIFLNNKPYEVLFSELSSEEASKILTRLQEDGVEYKYQDGGTILVPAEQEEELKAQLVYEGYPDSGFTYDIFTENVSLTTTESEKEHYQLLNLQERMGATIKLFPNVKDAKVTITLGKDSRYVLDDTNKQEASASATIITEDGQLLDAKAVKAIQRLMSKSIEGIEFENVAVICNGQDITVEEEGESQSLSNELKTSLEKNMENKVRNQISNLLAPIYGEGHYQVSVKCEIDVNKKLQEIINYSAEDPERNTGVISNESAGWEINRDDTQTGGVPGTETNSDIPVYTTITSDGTENYIGADGDITYLVDQLKEQIEVQAGDVTDMTVAVIVDGTDFGGLSKNELISLVARAAGIDQTVQNEKVEVLNAPFYEVPEEEPEVPAGITIGGMTIQPLYLIIAAALLALIIIIVIVILVLRRRKKKKAEEEARLAAEEAARLAEEEAAALAEEEAARLAALDAEQQRLDAANYNEDLLSLKNERGMELKNKIREFTEENPEISAQLLKRWLQGGDENDG